jgi:thiamine-phosphate pyrophosphorylase
MTVPRLMLLTDRAQLPPGRTLVDIVRECAQAGLTHVVVREHDLAAVLRRTLVVELASIEGVAVISSRLPDPAAVGTHLASGQERPESGWFGRSCHSAQDVRAAAVERADYATLSPYAPSTSKPGYGPLVNPDTYADDCGIPVLALGGIHPGNAAHARAAGAYGVAVMGCVMRACDPGTTVRVLLAEVDG